MRSMTSPRPGDGAGTSLSSMRPGAVIVARFIDWHHQGGEPRLQRWSDGRFMRITERRLPNGCTVATYRDVDETPSPMYNPLLTYARQV